MPYEEPITAHFPKAGIDHSRAVFRQPARKAVGDDYSRTTYWGQNVRASDHISGRNRGGSRAGVSKYLDARPGNIKWATQHLKTIVTTGGATVQTSNAGRVVTLLAIAQGELYSTVPEGETWTTVTNDSGTTPAMNPIGIIRSAPNNQKLYLVDGDQYRVYDPNENKVSAWTATAGTLPIGPSVYGNRKAKLICTWRGRTVLSGVVGDPQNWFMSRVSDPLDFDYQTGANDSAQAVAGNNSPMGLIGDVVNCLIPYSDDVLIFGGDSTIYAMRGDPYHGGSIDLVTAAVGMAYGEPWAMDEKGVVYFFGNTGGVYAMDPRGSGQPVWIGEPIDRMLREVNTGTHGVIMEWDDVLQTLHVWVTFLAMATTNTHFAWERRTNSWWVDTYANNNHNPLVSCVIDGNRPGDRAVLIGSWDGYVRKLDRDATTDDGVPIDSRVVLGPFTTKTFDEIMVEEIQPTLADGSGGVDVRLYVGETPELALQSTPHELEPWAEGRGAVEAIRAAGHAVYLDMTSSDLDGWAMESIRLRIRTLGKVRRRA